MAYYQRASLTLSCLAIINILGEWTHVTVSANDATTSTKGHPNLQDHEILDFDLTLDEKNFLFNNEISGTFIHPKAEVEESEDDENDPRFPQDDQRDKEAKKGVDEITPDVILDQFGSDDQSEVAVVSLLEDGKNAGASKKMDTVEIRESKVLSTFKVNDKPLYKNGLKRKADEVSLSRPNQQPPGAVDSQTKTAIDALRTNERPSIGLDLLRIADLGQPETRPSVKFNTEYSTNRLLSRALMEPSSKNDPSSMQMEIDVLTKKLEVSPSDKSNLESVALSPDDFNGNASGREMQQKNEDEEPTKPNPRQDREEGVPQANQKDERYQKNLLLEDLADLVGISKNVDGENVRELSNEDESSQVSNDVVKAVTFKGQEAKKDDMIESFVPEKVEFKEIINPDYTLNFPGFGNDVKAEKHKEYLTNEDAGKRKSDKIVFEGDTWASLSDQLQAVPDLLLRVPIDTIKFSEDVRSKSNSKLSSKSYNNYDKYWKYSKKEIGKADRIKDFKENSMTLGKSQFTDMSFPRSKLANESDRSALLDGKILERENKDAISVFSATNEGRRAVETLRSHNNFNLNLHVADKERVFSIEEYPHLNPTHNSVKRYHAASKKGGDFRQGTPGMTYSLTSTGNNSLSWHSYDLAKNKDNPTHRGGGGGGPPLDRMLADDPSHPLGVKKDLAALSKNISAVLESLLKDYNNKIRPGYKAGKLTTIKMNMLIRSMGPIAEKDMKYSMDCYLRQEWHDDRLTFQGPLTQLTLNIKMLEALWKPDTFFHNGLGSYVHTITRPNKLFRITQDGRILYSMRLTIKAKCPMELRNFPMDKQSCPLIISSYAYTEKEVKYQWDSRLVSFEPGMALSQFDLLNTKCINYSAGWRTGQGNYSVLQVNFNLQRHTGYFLIQVYVPCFLIVVLSWVSFWLNREATSDRVGLGITTVLTLSTISLDSRTDLPKVHYATALDWFILMSFGYCMATLLQCAGVHYFTKVGSGDGQYEDEWQDIAGSEEELPLPKAVRRAVAARPCTISSYSLDECSTSVLGLSSSVLLLDGARREAVSLQPKIYLEPNQQHPQQQLLHPHQNQQQQQSPYQQTSPRPQTIENTLQQGLLKESQQLSYSTQDYQHLNYQQQPGRQTDPLLPIPDEVHFGNQAEAQKTLHSEIDPGTAGGHICLQDGGNAANSHPLNQQEMLQHAPLSLHQDTAMQGSHVCGNGDRTLAQSEQANPVTNPYKTLTLGYRTGQDGRYYCPEAKPTTTGLSSTTIYTTWASGDDSAVNHNSSPLHRNAETQTARRESFWFQFARCIVGSQSYRRERERQATIMGSANSVSRIDKLSRILFPLSYGLLNLWYWYSYYDTELAFSWTEPGLEHVM